MVLENGDVWGFHGGIKDVLGWHVEAHGWCTSEGKGPLGKGEWVRLVHDSLKGLEAHREWMVNII